MRLIQRKLLSWVERSSEYWNRILELFFNEKRPRIERSRAHTRV